MPPDSRLSPPTPAASSVAPENAPVAERLGWRNLKNRANMVGRSAALVSSLVLLGAGAGYFYSLSGHAAVTKSPTISTLSPSDLSQLGRAASKFGSAGQTLSFAPDSVFQGKVAISGDLSVGGHLNTNGPVSLSSLTVTGTTAAAGLNVSSNLAVGGDATLQKTLTVAGLASVATLNVAGNASVNALNASSIIVRTISASGPITISHLTTQGPPPTISAVAVGNGGNVSISGNDTAGVININTGSGPGSTLATITFRAAYGANVHVLLMPRTDAAAGVGAYVTSTAGAFQVDARTPLSGASLSFDYLVAQ
jgi:cytoskeletal protein CcmA (bactofilin family)